MVQTRDGHIDSRLGVTMRMLHGKSQKTLLKDQMAVLYIRWPGMVTLTAALG